VLHAASGELVFSSPLAATQRPVVLLIVSQNLLRLVCTRLGGLANAFVLYLRPTLTSCKNDGCAVSTAESVMHRNRFPWRLVSVLSVEPEGRSRKRTDIWAGFVGLLSSGHSDNQVLPAAAKQTMQFCQVACLRTLWDGSSVAFRQAIST
jgi:hypothetical protein